jgi:hypothetical protein
MIKKQFFTPAVSLQDTWQNFIAWQFPDHYNYKNGGFMSWINQMRVDDNLKVFLHEIVSTIEQKVPEMKLSPVTFLGVLGDNIKIETIPLLIADAEDKLLMDLMLRSYTETGKVDFTVTVLETLYLQNDTKHELKNGSVAKKSGILVLIETRFDSYTVLGKISQNHQQINWQKLTGPTEGLFNDLIKKVPTH